MNSTKIKSFRPILEKLHLLINNQTIKKLIILFPWKKINEKSNYIIMGVSCLLMLLPLGNERKTIKRELGQPLLNRETMQAPSYYPTISIGFRNFIILYFLWFFITIFGKEYLYRLHFYLSRFSWYRVYQRVYANIRRLRRYFLFSSLEDILFMYIIGWLIFYDNVIWSLLFDFFNYIYTKCFSINLGLLNFLYAISSPGFEYFLRGFFEIFYMKTFIKELSIYSLWLSFFQRGTLRLYEAYRIIFNAFNKQKISQTERYQPYAYHIHGNRQIRGIHRFITKRNAKILFVFLSLLGYKNRFLYRFWSDFNTLKKFNSYEDAISLDLQICRAIGMNLSFISRYISLPISFYLITRKFLAQRKGDIQNFNFLPAATE